MYGSVKYVEFVKFDFSAATNTPVNLNCSYDFKAQASGGTADTIRAVMVSFHSESEDNSVHFHAQCRVVFDLANIEEIPEEDDFITENCKIAYQEFCRKSNEVFVVLGQNPFEFHDI